MRIKVKLVLSHLLSKNSNWVIFIFLTAVAIRLVFVINMQPQLIWYDEIQYNTLAERLLQGLDYNSPAFAPLQTYFLYGLYSVFGPSVLIARIVQTIIGSLTAVLIFYLGKILISRETGIIASAMSVPYPFFIYITGVLYPTVLFSFLLVCGVHSFAVFIVKDKILFLILSGLCLGLAALTIPVILAVIPAFFLWYLLYKQDRLLRSAILLMLWLACLFLTILPWSIRNYHTYNQFMLVTAESGHALWQGNNEFFDGVNRPGPDDIPVDLRRKLEGLPWDQQDKVFKEEGYKFIRNHPIKFTKLYIVKFLNFWRFYPNSISKNQYTTTSTKIVSILSYGIIFPLSLFGLFKMRRQWRKILPLFAIPLFFSFAYSLFLTSTRYRIPVEPFLLIIAAAALWLLIRKQRIFSVLNWNDKPQQVNQSH